jgi:beta-galactosidase
MSGGLYRDVRLISTANPVHIDLGDLGGAGVYATTTSITDNEATVKVRTRLASSATEDAEYSVRASLLDDRGNVAATTESPVGLKPASSVEVSQALVVRNPHLWQGIDDPYQYKLVVDVLKGGEAIDRMIDHIGIRQMRFDAEKGFFLNGKHVALHGVAMEQDDLGMGWAITPRQIDESMSFVKEIGANALRPGHAKFNPYAYDVADRMGLIVWAELPFMYGVDLQPNMFASGICPTQDPSSTLWNNAQVQLKETIRQLYNHPSIALWSVGNEITYQSRACMAPPYDNVTPLLRELNKIAKQEDPARVTSFADMEEAVTPPLQGGYIATGGNTDTMGINQYYLWYSGPVAGLGELLDAVHARYPSQPLGMSEYGGGGALTQHSDNPLGGPPEVTNFGNVFPVVFQPEEYQCYLHEQNYAMLQSKPYLWGTFAWALFDFGSGVRNEGDLRGVNTKGLVTFDRKTRKDAFYFYKANWSGDPVTYIVGRRYTNRSYPVADVKVYSNTDSVKLSINGKHVGTLSQTECVMKACVFKEVKLSPGVNKVVAVGSRGGNQVSDSVEWSLNNNDAINIVAGQLETGFKSSSGAQFGSDNFFIGGSGDSLENKNTHPITDSTAVSGTNDPDLYRGYRQGDFSYYVPLPDGTYEVRLGFLEPDRHTAIGNRMFDVEANGEIKIQNLDVLQATGGKYRAALTKTFTTKVSGGHLKLDFMPVREEAVVSNISIHRLGSEGNAESNSGAGHE